MSNIAPTYPEFLSDFPAFSELSKETVEAAIALSSRLLDSEAWGEFFSNAVGLDAAHNLVLDSWMSSSIEDSSLATVGPVNSVSAAGVSTSFSTPEASGGNYSDSWYIKTAYGQRFLRLRHAVIPIGVLTC